MKKYSWTSSAAVVIGVLRVNTQRAENENVNSIDQDHLELQFPL